MQEFEASAANGSSEERFSSPESGAPYYDWDTAAGSHVVPSRKAAAFRALFILIAFVIVTLLAVKFTNPKRRRENRSARARFRTDDL